MSKNCPSCNTPNLDTAKFCRSCGSNLYGFQRPAPSNHPNNIAPVEKPKKKDKTAKYIFAFAIAATGWILLLCGAVSAPVSMGITLGAVALTR